MSWIDDHVEYMVDFEDMQTYYRDSELDRKLCKDGLWRTAKNQIIKIEDNINGTTKRNSGTLLQQKEKA